MVLTPEARTAKAWLVLQGVGVVRLSVAGNPVVDALASHAQSRGDLGDGLASADFQDRPRATIDMGIRSSLQLLQQPMPLPPSQF